MKHRRLSWVILAIGLMALVGLIGVSQAAAAKDELQTNPQIPVGAALYDNWMAALNVIPPAQDMPLWASQTTNTRSGPDTWRCTTCHGWDYQGRDGAYRSGSNFTGFPGVYNASLEMSKQQIIDQLSGKNDPEHDFSQWIDPQNMGALADFIKTALIDDNQYIDLATMDVISGDSFYGKKLYDQACATCHGPEGGEIVFRFEGSDVFLGDLAKQDPWRFLHKTRFGTPGTPMIIGYNLGWTPQDGRDVLKYAKALPSKITNPSQSPILSDQNATQTPNLGGPAKNLWTGLLTAFGAMAASFGFSLIVGAALVGIMMLIVWAIRNRK